MCVYFTLNVMASGSWLQKRAVYSCKSLFFFLFFSSQQINYMH